MITFIKVKIEEQTNRRKLTMNEIGKMISKAEVQKIENKKIQDALVS